MSVLPARVVSLLLAVVLSAAFAGSAHAGTLTYHGGNVMTSTTNHLIFWLPSTLQDGTSASVPNDYVPTIEQFFRDESGTSLYNTLTQYCSGASDGASSCPSGSNPIQNSATYGGAVIKTDPYPSGDCVQLTNCISDGTIENLIRNAIDASGWHTGLNDIFYVFTASGESTCKLNDCIPGSGGCAAEHDFFHTGLIGTGDEVVYAKIPFQDCTLPPGPHSPATDVAISFASHEQAEAVTDPDNGGWWDSSSTSGEIGDLCSGTGAFQHWDGHTYLLQEEWSNLGNGCVAGEPNHEIKGSSATAIQALPGCTANTLPANDDGSTAAIPLPFNVNFFGKPYSSLYVNNNGNVTFEQPLGTYTPFELVSSSTPIIAPLFADVDTRGPGSGVVTYGGAPASGGSPAYFCVNWSNVGYFNSRADLTDSAQLILIDRSGSTGTPGDFDIVFNYDNVSWETGDASGGSGGLGGTSVRAGYSDGSSRSVELTGSGVNGALLDGGSFALTASDQNSTTRGRYLFPVRNGNTPTGGAFEGTVTDTASPANPVGGAMLQFCAQLDAGESCAIASTNSDGHYSVSGLAPGDYQVRVSPPSSSSLFEKDLGPFTLTAGTTVDVDVALDGSHGVPPGTSITDLLTSADGTPVLDWNAASTLTTHGCAGASASYEVTIANSQFGAPIHGILTETPAGSGTYAGTITPTRPQYGAAAVVISITCPESSQDSTVRFGVYIDPAGAVVDTDGKPIAGATVTIYRSDASDGPFDAVPDGSTVLSAANRSNPDTTSPDGRFGWDVLAGYYKIRASKAGCWAPGDPTQASVETPVEQIPPAVDNLVLKLQCKPSVPSSVTAPAISGEPREGQVLTASRGAWGNDPSSYTYEWDDCDGAGQGCTPIATAAADTYKLAAGDVGHTIRVRVTASNAGGDATAVSGVTAVVRAQDGPSAAPANTSAPVVAGVAIVGQTISATRGAWSGTPEPTFAYQWERCAPDCVPIAGATVRSFWLAASDVNAKVRVVVTATNAAGSASASSAAVGPVSPATSDIKALLVQEIAPTRAAAKIAAIASHSGITLPFRTLTSGKVTVKWFFLQHRAHLGKAGSLLVATAERRFPSAGGTTLVVRLTPAGRRLVRSASARLKLVAKGVFTTTGGTAVGAQRRFTLRR